MSWRLISILTKTKLCQGNGAKSSKKKNHSSILRALDTLWRLLSSTGHHNMAISTHCEKCLYTYCHNGSLFMWRNGSSLGLLTHRFRIEYCKGLLFFWLAINFQKLVFSHRPNFFLSFSSQTHFRIPSLRNIKVSAYMMRYFFLRFGEPLKRRSSIVFFLIIDSIYPCDSVRYIYFLPRFTPEIG